MCHVPSVVNDIWSQIYAPLNGCSELGRYKGNCKSLLRWFKNGFSWSSYDLHPNIIPANFFWVKCVIKIFTLFWLRFAETFRRLPKISDEFPKTSERCQKLNVRIKDDTFSVLWYDFVSIQKRTQSHHVLRTICPDCESGVRIVLDAWYRCL